MPKCHPVSANTLAAWNKLNSNPQSVQNVTWSKKTYTQHHNFMTQPKERPGWTHPKERHGFLSTDAFVFFLHVGNGNVKVLHPLTSTGVRGNSPAYTGRIILPRQRTATAPLRKRKASTARKSITTPRTSICARSFYSRFKKDTSPFAGQTGTEQ